MSAGGCGGPASSPAHPTPHRRNLARNAPVPCPRPRRAAAGGASTRWWFHWNLELQRFINRVGGLPVIDGRPVPLHRRPPVGSPGLLLPRPPEPVAAAGEMAAGDPAVHRAVLPRYRLVPCRDRGVVRHFGHRPLSPVPPGPIRRSATTRVTMRPAPLNEKVWLAHTRPNQ